MHSYQKSLRLVSQATATLQSIQTQLQTAGDLLRSLERQILELRNNQNFLFLEVQILRTEVVRLQREVAYANDTDSSEYCVSYCDTGRAAHHMSTHNLTVDHIFLRPFILQII